MSRAQRWAWSFALTAFVAFGCTASAPAPTGDGVELRQSALNTNVTVTVQNTSGTAQSGKTVYVKKSTGSGFLTSGTTNAQGRVTFSLANGSYKFATPGFGDNFYFWSSTGFSCTTPSCTSATITVTAPITVTVLDTDGTPQIGAEVFAEKPNGVEVNSATVDANGHAVISVNTGSYRFSTPGVPNGFNFYSGASGSCVVAGCTTASITVQKTVAVTLIDGWGNPVADQEIDAIDANGDPDNMDLTDAEGHLSLSVDPGTYHFRVSYGGAYFESAACAVPGCVSATVQIEKPVLVTVTDGYGGARADETVIGVDSDYYQVNWETTDSNGQASLYLPPGLFTVRVIDGNMYFDSAAICEIPGCSAISLAVTDVLVTVTGSDGNPVSGLTVAAVDATSGYEINWIDTDGEGRADLFVPPGAAYKFRVVVDGNYVESGPDGHCQVTGCRTASITIPAPVVVSVVNASNQPIANQDVTADPESCELSPVTRTTDAQGHASFTLSPGKWRFRASCGQETFYSGNVGSCAVGSGCTTAQITMRCNTCSGQPNGHACNDGNPCTQTDTCNSGVCVGSNPIACTASDQCHSAGVCDVQTGACPNPPKADGSACNDGNACTQLDTCQGGTCVGADPVACVAQDQCHDPGSCNTSTGACSNPARANGSACSDGNGCTQTDTCQSGTCAGANPVTCAALDSCHDAGACAPLTGQCSNPLKAAGTACGPSSTCTAGGQCVSNNDAPIVNAGTDQTANLYQPKPPPTFTLQHISTQFNNPIGIEYHPILNKMVMSVNCCFGTPHNFDAINADGSHTQYTTISGLGDEVYFAIARDDGGGHNIGGFVAGQMFVGTGTPGVIARVSADGSTIDNPWLTLPGEGGRLRGQLQFDRTGIYGGDLLVTTTAGHLWRVTAAGSATQIATGLAGDDLEGLTAVPNDPVRYGPWAGKILIGDEDVDAVYAVDASGAIATYQLGVRPENIMVVPPGENFYGVDFNGGAVYGASASQFRDMVGDVLIAEENTGKLWHVQWNGLGFEKTLLADITLWEHTAFGPAPMAELGQSNVQVALSGTASDDGHPTGSTLSTTWSVVSGPGSVTFSDLHALSTTATFIEEGTYVLALTASDGELSTSDQVTVTVRRVSPNNQPPVADAGPDQTVRMPEAVVLSGSATDDGVPVGGALSVSWTMVSGPAEPLFLNPTAGLSGVIFVEPGTYVFALTASDGELEASDQTTVTVNPEPSLDGAHLSIVLADAGPLQTGNLGGATATLTDAANQPITDFPVRLTVTGANPVVQAFDTNANGVATFAWTGTNAGTDQVHATALGIAGTLDSATVSVAWTELAVGGPVLTQGWIASPAHQSSVSNGVPIVLTNDITLASGSILYWPAAHPAELHTLATGLSGAPGATLATLDTTRLANDTYVIDLEGTSSDGRQKSSQVLVTVTGDYKPGRVVVEVTDYTIPIAGMPITVGRRYDSLEKDRVGDFGNGWSLIIGHPRLEVSPDQSVTITMPSGRRSTFRFAPTLPNVGLVIIGFLAFPAYAPEPGVYGTLTSDGCPVLTVNPYNNDFPTCFAALSPGELQYNPTEYTYTDPYGTVYVMGKDGELRSIKDRQNNQLTFSANGITSNSGQSVTFQRDSHDRIAFVYSPVTLSQTGAFGAHYEYDPSGDLVTTQLMHVPGTFFRFWTYKYAAHRLLTSTDPRGNPVRTSTYDDDGRLISDKDALNHETTYTYNLTTRTNTTTLPDLGVVTQTFDAQGLLLGETDQRNQTTTHVYDASRNEISRTNALHEETTATYDAFGNQTSLTDPTGTTHTTYNNFNLPVTFTDRLSHITTIDYDEATFVPARFADELGTRFQFRNNDHGLPLEVVDAEGHVAKLEYDIAGNAIARRDWLGRTTRATYHEEGQKLTETSARGAVTTYAYFEPRWLKTTTDPNGYVVQNTYDTNGNVLTTSDSPSTHGQTAYEYNAMNQLTQVTHADSTTVSYTRDFRGNPLSMTDESGHTTDYEYDRAGNLTKTTFPLTPPDTERHFTMRTYDALNRLVTLKDERDNTTRYEYDPGCGCSDRVTKVTDPLGHATVTAYDANGRKSSVTDAKNNTTTFVYDVRNHLRETHYPDHTFTVEHYDSRGRRDSMTDQMNLTTLYGYDDQGQLISVTDPLTHVTHYGYDLDGNLTSVTDANNHTTTYEYDVLKRKIRRTLPLGRFETFAYDLAGRQTSHTDFHTEAIPGKTTTMTYDVRDRMLTKVPDPSLGEATHVYTYFPNGLRHTATNASGTTTYAYDERDRLKTKAATAGTLTYTYYENDSVRTISSSNTNGTYVEYGWDDANELASVTDHAAGGTTTASYTPTRRPETVTQPNGIGLTYAYDDPMDRVTSMVWSHGMSPAFGSWAYTYSDRGQRLGATDITGRSAAYGYDDASRLTSETISGDPRGANFNGALSYILDGAGNRTSRASTLAALGAQTFSYNANDELSSDTYDANGNALTAEGHAFTYDFENRLISKDNGAVTIQYNCDGDRVAKTVAGVTTRYLVDDLNPTGYLQVLEEVVGSAVQARYSYGTSIVSQTRSVSTTPVTTYYGYDAHGNIAFLTDATGAVTDSYDFDAWGGVVAHTGFTQNTRLYAGEEFDPDLGLVNLRARQYNASAGRFLTLDWLMGSQQRPTSLNRYLYANGDPVNLRDPLGMAPEYAGLASGVAGTLTIETTVALGLAAKTTTTVIGAAVATYVLACAMFIVADAILPSPVPPPPPFTLCKIRLMRCTNTGDSGPMGSCKFKCPDGTFRYGPCTKDDMYVPRD